MYQLGMVAGFLKIRHADAVPELLAPGLRQRTDLDGGAFDLM
jgi:hypothetical protein